MLTSTEAESWLSRRVEARKRPPDILADSFEAQRSYVLDESPLLYAFCTRRAAKSYSGGLRAFRKAMARRCNVLIAGLVRDEVKRIFWQPILHDIAERKRIECKFNETELSVRFPNGSFVYLVGMDADEKQKRKALGQKFADVIIDEAQDWTTDLNAFVFHVLKPAVADYRGSISLLGTPGLVAKGLFYDVTTGKEPGWKCHEWTTFDNTTREVPTGPTMAQRWGEEIEQLKKLKPGVEQTPWFRRNYLREWVVDTDALVYRYLAQRNDFGELPHFRRGEWSYVLGCDLGYADATAFVVVAYHPHDRSLYVLETHAESGLDITAAANFAKTLGRKYSFDTWVVDGANKQAVEEMRRRHEIPWKAADKAGKSDFIELMNAEFLTGGIKLKPATCQSLTKEYTSLIWDQKKLADGKREEDARCDNHCTDATLYAWRYCYPYLSQAEKDEAPPAGSQEWYSLQQLQLEQERERMEQSMLEEAERMKHERADIERDWEMLT